MGKRATLKRKWLLSGGLGAVGFGSGLCAVIEVAFMRHEGAPFWQWFLLGTVSLAVLITGLNFIINALKYKIRLENLK
ncbi:hypothetical protein E1176_01965 [Fulvivirga sp. RKSG066]|uniref:hypothetical protein n=1 Tax=Fulvivirga aurantia TaxID=2529383 RepID=UPI0012BD312B|nr:hypothetical protein [Fulvivirga aurantia]MTI19778.1 hypothetical protein [Fulvivirga aurantia]